MMPRLLSAAGLLALCTTLPACAFTCDQVRWGVAHPDNPLVAIATRFATPADLAKGKACLAKKAARHRVKPKAAPKAPPPETKTAAPPAGKTAPPAPASPPPAVASPPPVVAPVAAQIPSVKVTPPEPPKGHRMLQVLAGISLTAWLLIIIIGYYVLKNGGPSVVNFFKKIWSYVTADLGEVEAVFGLPSQVTALSATVAQHAKVINAVAKAVPGSTAPAAETPPATAGSATAPAATSTSAATAASAAPAAPVSA